MVRGTSSTQTIPGTPRTPAPSSGSTAPGDSTLNRALPRGDRDFGQSLLQTGLPRTDTLPPGNPAQRQGQNQGQTPQAQQTQPIPQTQQSSSPRNRFTDTLPQDGQRLQSPPRVNGFMDIPPVQNGSRTQPPLRSNRLVTDQTLPQAQQAQRTHTSVQPRQTSSPPPQQQFTASAQSAQYAQSAQSIHSTQPEANPSPASIRPLAPGTILRGGRYRLHEVLERQEWLAGVFEVTWVAQDKQRGGSQVMMCELVLPDSASVIMQSLLRATTVALTSVGRHPHIPTLWDAFSDQAHNFFVFEPIAGESLYSHMRRTGRALDEQDVIECCLQMTEVLELLAQQSPPLVHGLIRPEHIFMARNGSYVLSNFSLVLAGGATQFVTGIERSRLSPYMAPEVTRGLIDVRSDLYSLMATAYHVVTGSLPTGISGGIPQAQRVNPRVSAQFDAILAKGLRPVANQRYQHPSELRQDLLAMRSVSGSLLATSGQRLEQPARFAAATPAAQALQTAQRIPDSVAAALPMMLAPTEDVEERARLLPRPEELPPMTEGNDTRNAALWLGFVLLFLVLIVVVGRGLF